MLWKRGEEQKSREDDEDSIETDINKETKVIGRKEEGRPLSLHPQ